MATNEFSSLRTLTVCMTFHHFLDRLGGFLRSVDSPRLCLLRYKGKLVFPSFLDFNISIS